MRPRDIMAAANAYKEAFRGNVVSDGEIGRRASICKGCPKRRTLRGIPQRVAAVISGAANRYRVPADIRNHMCGVCGCPLLALIPARPEDLHKDTPEQKTQRPEKCWIDTSG